MAFISGVQSNICWEASRCFSGPARPFKLSRKLISDNQEKLSASVGELTSAERLAHTPTASTCTLFLVLGPLCFQVCEVSLYHRQPCTGVSRGRLRPLNVVPPLSLALQYPKMVSQQSNVRTPTGRTDRAVMGNLDIFAYMAFRLKGVCITYASCFYPYGGKQLIRMALWKIGGTRNAQAPTSKTFSCPITRPSSLLEPNDQPHCSAVVTS